MLYAETDSTDPYYNLAFEEYILCSKTDGEWLLLWQNDNTVVIGLNQNASEEIDPDFVNERGVRVARRTTGGGAVYHDIGNLNYSFITDAGGTADLSMERFTGAICAALAAMGLEAEPAGRNDITVCGRKVSGTAQRLYKGRILHHGTLLFSSDLSMLRGALRADRAKFSSKSTKSIQGRVGNICDYLHEDCSIEDFKERLRLALTAGRCDLVRLSAGELAEVEKLADEKYRTWEWNYGTSPPYTMKKRDCFEGGCLEVAVSVSGGFIERISFHGDFMARMPLDPLTAELVGRRFDRFEAASLLAEYPVEEMFGSISTGQILDLMFK